MATLDDIWRDPDRDIRWVAVRESWLKDSEINTKFISLGHKTPDASFKDASTNQPIAANERKANDWIMVEIVPNKKTGRPKRFLKRPSNEPTPIDMDDDEGVT